MLTAQNPLELFDTSEEVEYEDDRSRIQINRTLTIVDEAGVRVFFQWQEPLFRFSLSDSLSLRYVAVQLRLGELATQEEIAQWFQQGVSNREMAKRLGVSQTTIHRALTRLGLHRQIPVKELPWPVESAEEEAAVEAAEDLEACQAVSAGDEECGATTKRRSRRIKSPSRRRPTSGFMDAAGIIGRPSRDGGVRPRRLQPEIVCPSRQAGFRRHDVPQGKDGGLADFALRRGDLGGGWAAVWLSAGGAEPSSDGTTAGENEKGVLEGGTAVSLDA